MAGAQRHYTRTERQAYVLEGLAIAMIQPHLNKHERDELKMTNKANGELVKVRTGRARPPAWVR